MDKYVEQMEKARKDRLFKSFGYKSETKDELQKSHIESIFEVDAPSRGFVIEKKGDEIKEKLKEMLSDKQQECAKYSAQYISLGEKLTVKPETPAKDELHWLMDGWEERIGEVPNIYSWTQIEKVCENECPKTVSQIGTVVASCDCEAPFERAYEEYRNYNRAVERYIGCKKEIALLETMISNFEDSKNYKLTVREAAMLGW